MFIDATLPLNGVNVMRHATLVKPGIFAIMAMLSQLAFAAPAGSVTFKVGDVTITHADKTVVQAVKNAELNAGDTIETKDGRLQLALIDGGKVSLQPNTIYKINKYEFASGKEDGSEYGFTELIKGGLRTISGLIGHKNRDHYQLKTAVATIGIRGTEFTVNFNDNNLLMTTNHGSVDVCNAGGCLNAITGQTIEVAGVGASPKPSDKKAKAAAAAPASSKATFAASDSIKVAALTTTAAATTVTPVVTNPPAATTVAPVVTNPPVAATVTPVVTNPPVLIGSNTTVSLATLLSGASNNGVYSGTASFKGNVGNGNPNAGNSPNGNALNQFTDNTASTNIVTGTTLAASNDGIVRWGSSAGGTLNGQNVLMSSWITGIATPTSGLANLVGTYNVFASTAPFMVNGATSTVVGAPNTVNGIVTFNFSTNNLAYALTVATVGDSFNLNGGATINANNPTFAGGTGTVTTLGSACGTGCSAVLNGGASLVQGAFFGTNGQRIGLQYGFNVPVIILSGSGESEGGTIVPGGQIYGTAVAKQ